MSHARHRSPAAGSGVSRRALPAVLLTVAAVAFAGLAAVPAAVRTTTSAPAADVLAFTAEVPVIAPVEPERSLARASRSRRIEQRAAADARAKAEAAAAAKQKAADVAAAQARARDAAAATAKAAAATRLRTARAASLARSGTCPVPSAHFTDTWGAARSNGRSHKGTDMMASYGDPVYAVFAGTVRTAFSSAGGTSLYLRADNGETYFYAHNSANVVSTGQRVSAGDVVARVGSERQRPRERAARPLRAPGRRLVGEPVRVPAPAVLSGPT